MQPIVFVRNTDFPFGFQLSVDLRRRVWYDGCVGSDFIRPVFVCPAWARTWNQCQQLKAQRIRPTAPKSIRCTASAFGGAPHQSEKVLWGTFSDSFSPRGEALFRIDAGRVYGIAVWFRKRLLPWGRSCQKSALRNRFLTDVGDRRRRRSTSLQLTTRLGEVVER